MIEFQQLVAEIDELTDDILEHWIEEGWVRPQRHRDRYSFSEVDAARIRMICDIHFTMHVDEHAMPVVLNLLDQIYRLRRQVNTLSGAIRNQPDKVRRQITEDARRLLDAIER